MTFPTRGLSWITPMAAALLRDFRDTSERLGFRGAVHPETWGDIEQEHIRASAALCHYIAECEKRITKQRKSAGNRLTRSRR